MRLLVVVQLDSLDRAGGPTCSRRDVVVSDGYARRSAPPKNRVPEYLARMLPAYREYRPPVGVEPVVACLWEHEPAEDRAQRVVPDGAWT